MLYQIETTPTNATNYVDNSSWVGVVRIVNIIEQESPIDWINIKKIKEAKRIRTIEGIKHAKKLHSKMPNIRSVDKRLYKQYKREPRMTQRFATKQQGIL